MMAKATLFCLFLVFGLSAGQLFDFLKPVFNNNNNVAQTSAPKSYEDYNDDAIIISDPNKFPNPDDEVTHRPSIWLPDPETEKPIGSTIKPSNGGFQMVIPEFPTQPPEIPEFIGDKPKPDDGEIPITDFDFSKKTTPKPPEDKGLWGNIWGGWKEAIDGQKKAIEDTYNSAVDAGGKWINATKNTADQLIDAKHQVLESVNLDTSFLNATKQVVDTVFDKKSQAWDSLHTKQKGLSPAQQDDQGFFDAKSDDTFVWNPPNDVAGDIFDPVDFESDENVTSGYESG